MNSETLERQTSICTVNMGTGRIVAIFDEPWTEPCWVRLRRSIRGILSRCRALWRL